MGFCRRPILREAIIFLSALVLPALLGACVTLGFLPSASEVERTVALVDAGRVGELSGLSEAPFLFDGEILLRQADVRDFWANLKASGFATGGAKVVSVAKAGPESYKLFSPSMEVKAFFRKYLDRNSAIATVESATGRYYLVLGREVRGYPRIIGFKGPVK